ncbi:methanobactin export MATE transporter MbnM [Pannonibacter tanglangensis]|uniref:Di-heme enzyme n=1 Tax=Pannonibacter tanglangensis TaxID=2750084 RepID=A0ABW9ZHX6_9HYPH|nr:methanobactin export MATE transporter MbnM [Pannonibacter sp. XCT-34]NBN64044.1 di-heme enzyme [Pannonibacter sp. XCT-34]
MRRLLQTAAASVWLAVAVHPAAAETFVWPLPAWMPPPVVPGDNAMTAAKVDLGRHLFYDARLSADGTVACVSCHVQERAFTDGRPTSVGIDGTTGHLNAPSLANAAYLPVLTWANPHMTTLEFQALVPLFGEAPVEMGGAGREVEIFARLAADPYYATAFAAAFPERPQPDLFTVTRALAAFQRSIVSVASPYDRFKYGGQSDALSEAAQRGEQLFFDHRLECYHCHSGIHFTNNLKTIRTSTGGGEAGYHNTGLHDPYPDAAPGLIEITGREADAGRFRTPSLRNVALTAPYMHDGSIPDLRGVLEHYARGGRAGSHPQKDGMIVGFEVSPREIDDLIAFLESLTDETLIHNPALADPWPEDHPARARRVMP